jgi:hypothetical protein
MLNRGNKTALIVGSITFLLLFCRNALMYWLYSFSYFPDSILYIQLGKTFFSSFKIHPLVMFPYPLLNALTLSYYSPLLLIWLQIFLAAAAGGYFVYVVGRKNLVLAWLLGLFFLFDLAWGSLSRVILTDGLFATFFMFSLAVLLNHFDKRSELKDWEVFLAGMLYTFTCLIRPSHIFIVILLPFVYLWLARSWKKALVLVSGLLTIFLITGLINLRGYGKFSIFPSSTSYTDVNTAFPIFVYKLFSPENGPVSKHLDEAIQQCYPGLDYQASVGRSEGGPVDSEKNMAFVHGKVIPCLYQILGSDGLQGQFPRAYMEVLKSQPERFMQVMYQENMLFLRYQIPLMLRWNLLASRNHVREEVPWSENYTHPRLEWKADSPITLLYEKIASKTLQVYLAPMGIIARLSPEKNNFPYAAAWVGMILFVALTMRGRNLFLATCLIFLILFTSGVVVAGHGFTERYPSMLSPMQTTLSALVYYTLAELIIKFVRRLKNQASLIKLGTV